MNRMVSRAYHEAEISKLHLQIATMQDTIVDLRRKLVPRQTRFPAVWRLSPTHDRMLAALVDAAPAVCSHERMKVAACGSTSREILDNTLTMHVTLLRKRMLALGFGRIESSWNVGYYLRAETAAAIRKAAARALGEAAERVS